MDKIAVAGYMTSTKKLQLKIMSLDEAVDMLKSYKYYTPEQLDKLKKDIVNPKGYFVGFNFNDIIFRMLKVD